MPNTTIVPSYYEYSIMSDYGYLDAASAEDKATLLTVLNDVSKEGEAHVDWEVLDYPNGSSDSGYVGAVFIHPT